MAAHAPYARFIWLRMPHALGAYVHRSDITNDSSFAKKLQAAKRAKERAKAGLNTRWGGMLGRMANAKKAGEGKSFASRSASRRKRAELGAPGGSGAAAVPKSGSVLSTSVCV